MNKKFIAFLYYLVFLLNRNGLTNYAQLQFWVWFLPSILLSFSVKVLFEYYSVLIYFKHFFLHFKFQFTSQTNRCFLKLLKYFFYSSSCSRKIIHHWFFFNFFLFASKIFIFFKSVTVPFRGDYVNLRRMVEWRDALRQNRLYHSDRYVVFADVVNEMYKPNGKVEKR